MLIHGDCLEVMKQLPDNSVDCIVTDPPYFKVKNEPWDRQWDKPQEFLSWLGVVADEWHRLLKPNGSLYCFASPQMASRVEVMLMDRFAVLNNIRWQKSAGWHNKTRKEDLRQYLSPWEAIIFAEHQNSDNVAKGEAGYLAECDRLRGFVFEPLRRYIVGEFERAGMMNTAGKIAANVACGFSPSTGGMASRHYFSQSQWCLPTPEHYDALRELLNKDGGQYLRREYEDLRREYEDLRRPFSVSSDVPYTDVWTFATVKPYKGKHPCEKPLDMLDHIIKSSTKPDAVVLDSFMGHGNTGISASRLGRKFMGIEMDQHHFDIAKQRIEEERARNFF